MPLSHEFALVESIFWNKYTLSFRSDSPVTFIWRQVAASIPKIPDDLDLTGQTVLVTGANGGVGLAAAKRLVNLGASVILAVRRVPKGEEAKELLLKERPDAKVEVRELDLASFDSIKNFAKKLEEEVERVDIAILNAAIYNLEFHKSNYGYEQQLQVNALGNFLLSLLLLPVLQRTSALRGRPARLLVVTSEVHAFSHFNKATAPNVYRVETDAAEANFSHGKSYQLSKLFIILLTRELSRWLDPSKIILAQTSPGFCNTGLLDDIQGFIPRLTTKIFARSADEGARLYLHAALLTSDEEYNGAYFRSGASVKTSEYTRSEQGKAFGKELWQQTLELLKKETPGMDLTALVIST